MNFDKNIFSSQVLELNNSDVIQSAKLMLFLKQYLNNCSNEQTKIFR